MVVSVFHHSNSFFQRASISASPTIVPNNGPSANAGDRSDLHTPELIRRLAGRRDRVLYQQRASPIQKAFPPTEAKDSTADRLAAAITTGVAGHGRTIMTSHRPLQYISRTVMAIKARTSASGHRKEAKMGVIRLLKCLS